MRVADVAGLLSGLAAGGEVETETSGLVDAVVAAGLARDVPDMASERTRLETLQARLRSAATEDARRALRRDVLALSEALAMSTGGARVIAGDAAGGYREAAGERERRVVLTQRGRAFLADQASRSERAAGMTIDQFEREMEALRTTLSGRARRAASIATNVARISTLPNAGAWRSAAIGLAACREDENTIATAFQGVIGRFGARLAPWTMEQAIAAAECMCLVAPRLADLDADRWVPALLDQRDELLRGICANRPEHALDTVTILAGAPSERRAELLAAAIALVQTTESHARPIPLPTALVCVATGVNADGQLPRILAEHAPRLVAPGTDLWVAADALALGLATGQDVSTVVDRIAMHRTELGKFSNRASISAAALLAWIDAPLAETLDDLRLCAGFVQTHRLAVEPGETAGNAVKLLLVSALLGWGREGDPEERLALAARPHARIASLGVGTMATSMPLLVGATAAFIQPLLDAAAIWDSQRRASQGYVHHGHHYG